MLLVNGRRVRARGHFLPPHPAVLGFFPTSQGLGLSTARRLHRQLRSEASSWPQLLHLQWGFATVYPKVPIFFTPNLQGVLAI